MAYSDNNKQEVNLNLEATPTMCLLCTKRNLPHEEILCNIKRIDFKKDSEFECDAFASVTGGDLAKNDEDVA